MPVVAVAQPGMAASYDIAVRNGKCKDCLVTFVYVETGEWDEEFNRPVTVRQCPKCGENIGQLLYQEASFMCPDLPLPPTPPQCPDRIEFYKKSLDVWVKECKEVAELYRLLHEYHQERSKYCFKHRNDEIEEKYRTGVPAPPTIEEAKTEIRKLRR